MTTLQLLKSASVVLDGTGAGTVVLGPERGMERWSVTRMNVQCTSATPTKCNIYRNIVSTATQLFGTNSGNQDVASGDPPLDIPASGRIVVAWNSGTAGGVATVVVEGTLTR